MKRKILVHCRVRNESICYIVFIDRAKPDNSVRINPATRYSETKYGFVILTGDMIFKDLFVAVKLLLRHEHLSVPLPMAADLIANATSEPPSGHSRSAESSSRERNVTRPSSYKTSAICSRCRSQASL